MELRQKQILDLKCYLQSVDTEVTMVLQSLQWDRKVLLEGTSKVMCQYDNNHKVPSGSLAAHEDRCRWRKLGYSVEDGMFADTPDESDTTFVKYDMSDIQQIINSAADKDPLFKRGSSHQNPLILERAEAYTTDERRAIYNAIVQAAPSCSDLSELALPSSSKDDEKGASSKSRLEILAELRDMKRRRTKYRVATKTRNYSDVLRDVIKTQMEVYCEINSEAASTAADAVTANRSNSTKDYNSSSKSYTHMNIKETKSNDSHIRENNIRYQTGNSRVRITETRTSSECSRYASEDNKYEENEQRDYTNKRRENKQKYYEDKYREKKVRDYEDRQRENKQSGYGDNRERKERDYEERCREKKERDYKDGHREYKHGDYENKYGENKQREGRHPSDRDKYYSVNSNRNTSSHEKTYENKYDSSHRREMSSSKDRSRDERSHRDKGNKTIYIKEENKQERSYKHKPEKEDKYKRYYDTQEIDEREKRRKK